MGGVNVCMYASLLGVGRLGVLRDWKMCVCVCVGGRPLIGCGCVLGGGGVVCVSQMRAHFKKILTSSSCGVLIVLAVERHYKQTQLPVNGEAWLLFSPEPDLWTGEGEEEAG